MLSRIQQTLRAGRSGSAQNQAQTQGQGHGSTTMLNNPTPLPQGGAIRSGQMAAGGVMSTGGAAAGPAQPAGGADMLHPVRQTMVGGGLEGWLTNRNADRASKVSYLIRKQRAIWAQGGKITPTPPTKPTPPPKPVVTSLDKVIPIQTWPDHTQDVTLFCPGMEGAQQFMNCLLVALRDGKVCLKDIIIPICGEDAPSSTNTGGHPVHFKVEGKYLAGVWTDKGVFVTHSLSSA